MKFMSKGPRPRRMLPMRTLKRIQFAKWIMSDSPDLDKVRLQQVIEFLDVGDLAITNLAKAGGTHVVLGRGAQQDLEFWLEKLGGTIAGQEVI